MNAEDTIKVYKNQPVATSPQMCYGCGFCKIICPVSAVEYLYRTGDNDFIYAYKNISQCINCGLCEKICPSSGWKNVSILGENNLTEIDKGLSPYEELCFCHSNDQEIRKNGTSGGIVTSVLLYLLDTKVIDGVLLPDYDYKLHAKYRIMTTPDEIIASRKSKYFCIPFDVPIKDMLQYENLAVVGLPCHLEALDNILACKPELKKKIYFKIGLFCGHVQKKLFYSHLMKMRKVNPKTIKRLEFRPGEWWDYAYFKVLTDKGFKTWQFRGDAYVTALIGSRLFSREACVYCPDFTASKSDLSLGDGWHPKLENNKEGFNYGVVRNKKALVLLRKMQAEGFISVYKSDIEEFSKSNLLGNLINKQLRIKKRMPYLRKRDKNALVNIKFESSARYYLKYFIYFKVKTIAEKLENANLMHRNRCVTFYIACFERYLLREKLFFRAFKPYKSAIKKLLKRLKKSFKTIQRIVIKVAKRKYKVVRNSFCLVVSLFKKLKRIL